MPSPADSFHRSTEYWSGTPNAASGPVTGVTKPSLTSLPVSAAAETVVDEAAAVEPVVTGALEVVGAAVVDVVCSAVPHAVSTPPRPAPRPTVAVTKPAACRNSRRLRVSSSLIRSWLLMMI